MPGVSSTNPISWADEVEKGEGVPPSGEVFDEVKGIKTITDYIHNEDGKMVKVVKVYKIEKRKVSKTIAHRKTLAKFGDAEHDPPGPNSANTIISEDIYMVFVHNKEHEEVEDDQLAKLKTQQKMVTCRICKGDHWTTRCPYKDTLGPMQEKLTEESKKEVGAMESHAGVHTPGTPQAAATTAAAAAAASKLSTGGKYVPPSMREGANRGRGESMMSNKGRGDESTTIRVTNLPEDTRETDLQELFKPFGQISRIYLAKDKKTKQSKGFAFITFHKREDAGKAIVGVSRFGYDHLILNVEWAKPSGQT